VTLADDDATVRTRRWGWHQPPATTPVAGRLERHWRWPVVVALLATIPAFYAELLEATPQLWATLVYLLAATAVAAALVHTGWHTRHSALYVVRHAMTNGLDVLLVLGLVASALIPPSSQSTPALLLRLGVAGLALVRMVWSLQHWVRRGSLVHLLVLAGVVLLLCGAGFWWLEPRTPTLADGLWLAFTTAATVGYGDIVPTTAASRIFAVFVVLLGFGVLSLVTAAIATAWIETEERRIEHAILRDLHRQIGDLRAEIAALRSGEPMRKE
jgi:voltage-gated potassium channel